MNARVRATSSGFAAAIVTLALAGPAVAQPRATKPPGAQVSLVDSQAAQPAKSPPWLQNLQSWLQAIAEHKPGEPDIPAILTGSATEAELEAVRVDFLALLDIHRRLAERGARAGQARYKNEDITVSGIPKLLGLTSAEAERSDATRILKRAAILHGDVAMLVIPNSLGKVGCTTQPVVVLKDGHDVGTGCHGTHWIQGRALLDAIRPYPRADPMVRLWYEATIAFLLERMDYANGVPQIDQGSLLFPSDPGLLFEHGVSHETFVSVINQAGDRGGKVDLRPASAHLKEAEALFRRAVELDPGFIEARIHHGAVLGALGRHDEAAGELRKAAASAQGPILRYYAELFLGNEEQALGGRDAARAHYNQASALFPTAQSPRIALSALARQRGDRVEALAAMRHVLNLPADERRREDPWWSYRFWFDKNAEMLLRDLYRPFLAGGQQ